MINLSSARSPTPTFSLPPSSPYPKPPTISYSLLKASYPPTPTGQSLLFPARWRRRRRTPSVPQAIASASLESAQSVLEAASVLAAIILVHESGHFLAASLQGIHVSKFAIGFGPVLARFVANGVEYSLRAFPLGGFVGFPDDDPDSDIPTDDADLLKNRPILDRLLVISAGVAANVVFAYLIVFTQVLAVGLPVQDPLPGVLVPDVRNGSAAARDGIRPGDVILGVDGASAPSISEVVDLIKMSPKRNVAIKVAREGMESLELNVVPDESSDGTGRIGVQLSPNFRLSKVRPRNLAEATTLAGKEFLGLTSTVLDGLKQIFLNFSQSAGKVSGPVAIIAVGAEVARSSSDGLFQFAAVINLNLAAINLLPLPALDGGSLALLLVEAARGGRKIPREVEQRIMSSGILLVVMLGLFLMVRDTLNLDFIKEIL
ncbi:probable membrane metalloprotease ARASP2, chloroplastic [Elaeis guineensis]|uniref:Probable membrane metalloprotease ARASP2, chloroplastic n=1 Tax=Elaeis guineensis var. tenera TaxID=51953 RepID=A0A6I9RBH8_ELAGV|nr:probable membrane metalloprotease ARASP2, chloroplastic [Elaeis guineensis]